VDKNNMPIIDQNGIRKRAQHLEKDKVLNGIDFVLISLTPPIHPTKANLQVLFFNENNIENLTKTDFIISGGNKILGGPGNDQVKVTAIGQKNTKFFEYNCRTDR